MEYRLEKNRRTLGRLRYGCSQCGRIGEQCGTIVEVVAEAFRSRRIVLRDETNNLLQVFERLRCENYFPAHPRIFSRTRSRGTPSPASSSAAALSSRASSAASSLFDSTGSSCDCNHAASADFS